MIETYGILISATVLFLASHIGIATHPLRGVLVGRLGLSGYLIVYSLVSFATFGWLIITFVDAPREYLWVAPTWVRHLPMGVMLIACIMIVAGYMTPNPTAVGPDRLATLKHGPSGIFRITRHPILSAILLWALVHIPASGQASAMILQAAIGMLALIGMHQIDQRKERNLGESWIGYAKSSSAIPLMAIICRRQKLVFSEIGWLPVIGGIGLYIILISAHRHIIGVSPLPIP